MIFLNFIEEGLFSVNNAWCDSFDITEICPWHEFYSITFLKNPPAKPIFCAWITLQYSLSYLPFYSRTKVKLYCFNNFLIQREIPYLLDSKTKPPPKFNMGGKKPCLRNVYKVGGVEVDRQLLMLWLQLLPMVCYPAVATAAVPPVPAFAPCHLLPEASYLHQLPYRFWSPAWSSPSSPYPCCTLALSTAPAWLLTVVCNHYSWYRGWPRPLFSAPW